MTERKVNVRLAAVGGDKLKADLVSIGKEGRQALRLIEDGGPGASSGLNMTGQAANDLMGRLETLAQRAARAAANMNEMATGGAGVMARINASTGVSGGMARDADDLVAYGRALDDVRAKFNPLFAEQRRHSESIAEIDRAYRTGAISLDEWVSATRREEAANASAANSIRQRQAAFENFVNTGLRDSIDSVTGVSGTLARTADDVSAYGQALDATRAKYNPMFAAIQKYRTELASVKQAHAAGAISADEMTAAISRLRQASLHEIGVIKGRVQGYQAMEKGAGMARFQMVQLGYQLNDIGVSLASGQNPLIVMVQQGAQIAQIYGNGQGGVGAAFRQVGQMVGGVVTRFPVLTGAIALGTAAVAGLKHEINETSKVTVTFGDTALAVWQVISEGIAKWIKPATDKIGEWFDAAWEWVVDGVQWVGNALINGITAAVVGIGGAVDAIPDYFSAAFSNAQAIVYDALAAMLNGMHDFLAKVAAGLNSVFGTSLSAPSGLMDAATGLYSRGTDAGLAAQTTMAGIDANRQATMDRISEIAGRDPMGDFFDSVSARAQDNARKRLAKDAKGKKGGGGGKTAKEEKDEADELIKSLEREMAVLKETDPIKQKMLEYSKQLKDATAEQKDRVLELVTALDEEKNGWNAIGRSLAEYAEEAKRIGDDIGDALVGAFDGAADAVGEFVKTGKADFGELIASMMGDLAKLAAQKYITGPLAGLVAGWFDPLGAALKGAGLNPVSVMHTGGVGGGGGLRHVSAANFINAPRLHDGMPAGIRSDEYAAILQRGERVLNRRQTRDYESGMGGSPTVVNFNGVRDVASFRQSRTQIAADLSRAVAMGRRGM